MESVSSRQVAHPRATWLDPASGGAIAWRDLLARLAERRVVLLGETHDVAEIHRWQLHVAVALHTLRPNLAIGFEMFPLRCQPVLDAWVAGEMDTETFIARSEWFDVWGFDPALYLPLFHFCRQQNLKMLALNCHRPLVTRVGQLGWEAIPVEERDGVTPSAPATDAYRAYLASLMSGSGRQSPVRFDSDRFVRAQQTWDRAFACRIADHLATQGPDAVVVGIIGRGHLEYGHGTPYQLADLGVRDVAVLLPTTAESHERDRLAGLAEAIFRLDTPEPPAPRLRKPEAKAAP